MILSRHDSVLAGCGSVRGRLRHFRGVVFLAVLAVLVAVLVGCKQKGPAGQLESTQALAAILAEEAAKAAGVTKQVLVISPGGVWGTPAPLEQAFTTAIAKRGLSIVATRSVDVGDPMRSGQIGLKRGDFLSALDQAAGAGAIVSFAGPPALTPGEAIKAQHPPVLVVATAMLGATAGLPGDRAALAQLLESKIIQLAVVDATEATSPSSGKSDAAHDLFSQHYRILRAPE
jgi:hypothetical protein